MQRTLFFITIIILIGILAWLLMAKETGVAIPAPLEEPQICTQEVMICPDGTEVGRTGPNCAFAPCPTVETPPVVDDLIVIDSPKANETVHSPIMVTGRARGGWYFEATFPIVVVDWDGRIIGEGYATAEGDWMTNDFVPFTATVTYTLPPDTPYKRGALILQKSNPSGLPEHDDAREIPILFE